MPIIGARESERGESEGKSLLYAPNAGNLRIQLADVPDEVEDGQFVVTP